MLCCPGQDQDLIRDNGNGYLKREFPKLSYMLSRSALLSPPSRFRTRIYKALLLVSCVTSGVRGWRAGHPDIRRARLAGGPLPSTEEDDDADKDLCARQTQKLAMAACHAEYSINAYFCKIK